MRQIGIREFNSNISKFLREAPLQIKKRNMVVATILPGETKESDKVATLATPIVATSVQEVKKLVSNVATSKWCKHGSAIGLCKYGCTR